MINNYDSFVYNVVQLLRESPLEPSVDVVLNDEVCLDDVVRSDGVVLSPGPGIPKEANRLEEMIRQIIRLAKPVLGICLGHQALAEAFGARLEQLSAPLHGHPSPLKITDREDALFRGCDTPVVGRYHSWVVASDSIPDDLKVSSMDEDGHIMSFYHAHLPIHAVQFHPESVITESGQRMIDNWLGEL